MSTQEYEQISKKAEQELNTHQAKTGEARREGLDPGAGVNSYVEKTFPGAEVKYGEGLTA